MHQLGDQWIELIDGVEHMVKAVEPFELCQGCLFNCNQGGCCWKGFDSCHMGSYFIIKDLGNLKDDMLQCPFCGEYPSLVDHDNFGDGWHHVILSCCHYKHEMIGYSSDVKSFEQQAIDAWNRRS